MDTIIKLLQKPVRKTLLVTSLWASLGLTGIGNTDDKRALYVPDDLEVAVWAESPQLYNPTSIDVDHRGRVWVTEAVNYRSFKNKGEDVLHHEKGDRVLILEDTDGDGKADKTTVFVEDKDLQAPMGVAVLGNKIIVSSAPSLIVYTDENGDDKPDKKEVFLTGFGGYDHDHSLHSLIAGPDGKLYFNTGNAGPHIVTDKGGWNLRSGSIYNGGTPYNTTNKPGMKSDDNRLYTGGLALRVDPTGKNLKVVAHNFRNAYELAVDSHGNMWQNDNDDEVAGCRTTWVMENGNAGYFSADGTRSWRADQRPGQSIFTAHWHQEDPGTMPPGNQIGSGSPTGVSVYEGDELGKNYRGMLLSSDAGRNVIFGYKPTATGAGFDLSNRIDFASSIGASTEKYRWDNEETDTRKWFRPSDVTAGTDGSVFIADWYDPIVGGHAMHDKEGFGRIYRVKPKNKSLKTPVIDLKTKKGQIQALLSPAVNVRNQGFVSLLAQGEKVVPDLVQIIEKDENPYHQSRAIWLLANIPGGGMKKVESLLKHPNEQIRLTAFRAIRSVRDVLPEAKILASDPSAAVRREVAISLRDVPFAAARDIVVKLCEGYDGKDRWYLEALGTAMDGKEKAFYGILLEKFGKAPLKWDDRMATLAWRLHPQESIGALRQRVTSPELTFEQRQQALTALCFIPSKEAALAVMDIKKMKDQKEMAPMVDWWLEFRSGNDWSGYYQVDKKTPELSAEVKSWQTQLTKSGSTQEEKSAAAASLAKDPTGAKMLIQMAAGNRLSPELTAVTAQHIFSNPDQSVRVLAGEYFKNGDAKSYNISEILKLKSEPARGKEAFTASCSSCHRTGSNGGQIGPDLTNIKNKLDKRALLDAIIHPDADIVFGYEPWMITTKSGETVYGFLQSEGETVLLKDATGKQISLVSKDIVKRERARTMMPDPTTLDLKEQHLADIAAYLMNF